MMAAMLAPEVKMPRSVWHTGCPNPWKDSFDTRGEARAVIEDMKRRYRTSKSKAAPLKVYECECGKFHLAGNGLRSR